MTQFAITHSASAHMWSCEADSAIEAVQTFNDDKAHGEPLGTITSVFELVDLTHVTGEPVEVIGDARRGHTFFMSEAQAERIHKMVSSQTGSLKNWIASAVERGANDYAKELVDELRCVEELYARFNMGAKRLIAAHTNKPVVTQHIVYERRN